MMTTLAWILVVVFAGLAGYLWFRRPPSGPDDHEALERLRAEVESGRLSTTPAQGEPEDVAALRRALATGWTPREYERRAAGDEALTRIARYLREAVVRPLEGVRQNDGDHTDPIAQALDALADLEFFTNSHDEELRAHDLTRATREVTREFASEYAVAVKLRGSERPVRARFARESLKDAVYLLLVNAARFGGERTVEVLVDEAEGRGRIRILDRGPGFSRESLRKATEPFYTTEKDSLGLGLTHARQVVEGFGGTIRVGNREGGGGEVELWLPPADGRAQA